MENTPTEAIHNNVGGTYSLAKNALAAEVETFVLVSTDKAVNPTSVMGVSKRLCELVVLAMNNKSLTKFVAVRFGNVLGSNGSVVPIFKNQIAFGGPLTITDPRVERYFMSISEAAGLIMQAGAVASGGQIFALDMGDPVKIVDLANMVISLTRLEEEEKIDIVFTGLKPGEKLSEELQYSSEDFKPTGHDKLLVSREGKRELKVLPEVDSLLDNLSNFSADQLKFRLSTIVKEYKPAKRERGQETSTSF